MRNSTPDISSEDATQTGGLTLLSTNGTQITDEHGNIVILRGVDLSGYEYIPPIQWVHHESDYAQIASWGFNVIRLPISWENLEPQAGVYNDSYLQNLVDQDIAWAKQYGIYVILDMHQICWSSHFTMCNGIWSAGFPKWAVSGYADNEQGMQLMIHDFFSGLGPNGTQPSASSSSLMTRFFAAWQHVASRYTNESTIAAYDVLNEPSQFYFRADPAFISTTIPSFYTNAIDAIRRVDQGHICFWEDPSAVAIQRPNVVYSPHYPQGSLYNYFGTETLVARVEQIVNLSRKWNVPVFIGEWGMRDDAPHVIQYINDSLSLYDTYSISAAWWDYAATGWAMDLFYANGTQRQILVQNLVRPFVREISYPTTLATIFNEHNQSFEIGGITNPLQIFISIPQGYSVKSIQTNAGMSIDSRLSLKERTLLLLLPVTTSKVIVQYVVRSS
jgi:endoglycosylceramidase